MPNYTKKKRPIRRYAVVGYCDEGFQQFTMDWVDARSGDQAQKIVEALRPYLIYSEAWELTELAADAARGMADSARVIKAGLIALALGERETWESLRVYCRVEPESDIECGSFPRGTVVRVYERSYALENLPPIATFPAGRTKPTTGCKTIMLNCVSRPCEWLDSIPF